jgi:hypothetical protein
MGKEPAEQVWDSATFVDFEQELNFAIRQIRAALGDDADQPRFLQTLPNRGYRFIAAVEGEKPPKSASPRIPVCNTSYERRRERGRHGCDCGSTPARLEDRDGDYAPHKTGRYRVVRSRDGTGASGMPFPDTVFPGFASRRSTV